MDLKSITPLILTFNEQDNIRSTLARLQWATEIVVVDSSSNDLTTEILAEFPNVRMVDREFTDHTSQWNFGLSLVQTEWVLAMDADYKCPEKLINELDVLSLEHDAYLISFHFLIFGKKLRASIYPPRISLFKTGQFEYESDGHTQLLSVPDSESVGQLKAGFEHDDRKPVNRWLRSQYNYADLELDKLLLTSKKDLGWKDRIRRLIIFAPVLTLFYCLFYKLLILDGWSGIYYTLQRVMAELILSLKLVDRRLRDANSRESKGT